MATVATPPSPHRAHRRGPTYPHPRSCAPHTIAVIPSLWVLLQDPLLGEADGLEGVVSPLGNVLGGMALLLARHQANQRLLDHLLELAAYLALPQIKMKTERDVTEWWQKQANEFPNVAVMARQYLGCPASSAAVERLFSQVGIAFAAKRKRADAGTLEDIMFSRINLP